MRAADQAIVEGDAHRARRLLAELGARLDEDKGGGQRGSEEEG